MGPPVATSASGLPRPGDNAEEDSGDDSGWYFLGFDVGFSLDIRPADGAPDAAVSNASWQCSTCNLEAPKGEDETRRIWSLGPSEVCCQTCRRQRPWHYRGRIVEASVTESSRCIRT